MARLPKLKPCPFCGHSDAFVERADFSSCYVFCNECSAKGPTQYQDNDYEETPGERAAIRIWNKRTRATRAARAVPAAISEGPAR